MIHYAKEGPKVYGFRLVISERQKQDLAIFMMIDNKLELSRTHTPLGPIVHIMIRKHMGVAVDRHGQ
jgi:hypothetical protein